MKKYFKSLCLTLVVVLLLTACSQQKDGEQDADTNKGASNLPKISAEAWQYSESDDVYWQVGISYCESPVDTNYETMGIFVPGEYMNATDNGDGTFTCEINADGSLCGYTALTAPIVFPVETPGYSAMAAPTDYVSSVSQYTSEGFVYMYAGCRGRDAGAPAGVTDLKAAVRYLRYNEGIIPGCMDRIFSYGMSGGGAQSALMGSTGDSELYTPYLESIGAVMELSDALCGSMCWCPITNLDYANEAYEWNMGETRSDLDEETQTLSDGMAKAFAQYINELGLKDEDGNVLVLSESQEGIYQAGSYYDYIKSTIETSLEHFLADTEFPYTAGSRSNGGMMGGMGGRGNFDGELPDDDFTKDGTGGFGKGGMGGRGEFGDLNENGEFQADGITRNENDGGLELSGTYETAQDYIDALNAETEWVTYDASTGKITITSVADFASAFKNATKSVGAFDDLNKSQGENTLFGYGDGEGAHFDPVMAELLGGTEYGDAYAEDLTRSDAQGNTVDKRLAMYTPMYYLSEYYDGYGSSNVAQYWRIRTGIEQGDTALCTEVDLALALENYGANVDFETVWGMGHVEAERTGSSSANFITWVNECLGNSATKIGVVY